MRSLLIVFLLSLGLAARDQKFTSNTSNFTSTSTSNSNSNSGSPSKAATNPFWTIGTRVDTSILAGLVAADAITTQRGLSQGYREANPLMRPFVTRGPAGQAAGSAIGFGSAMGVAYLLHHTHHYKAEHIAMRLMIAGEGAFVANNVLVTR